MLLKRKKKFKEKNVVIVVSLCYCYFLLWFELGGICRFLGGQTCIVAGLVVGCRSLIVDCFCLGGFQVLSGLSVAYFIENYDFFFFFA